MSRMNGSSGQSKRRPPIRSAHQWLSTSSFLRQTRDRRLRLQLMPFWLACSLGGPASSNFFRIMKLTSVSMNTRTSPAVAWLRQLCRYSFLLKLSINAHRQIGVKFCSLLCFSCLCRAPNQSPVPFLSLVLLPTLWQTPLLPTQHE